MKKDTSNVNELSGLIPLEKQDIFIEDAFPFEMPSDNTLFLEQGKKEEF